MTIETNLNNGNISATEVLTVSDLKTLLDRLPDNFKVLVGTDCGEGNIRSFYADLSGGYLILDPEGV